MTAPARTGRAVEELPCGCSLEVRADGGRQVAGRCGEAEALFVETKRAGRASNDPKVRGGAKVKLCREFDRRRSAFREHVGLGR